MQANVLSRWHRNQFDRCGHELSVPALVIACLSGFLACTEVGIVGAVELRPKSSLKNVRPPDKAPAAAGEPVDLNRYCVARLGNGASAVLRDSQDAFAWRSTTPRASGERHIDMDEACRKQYGSMAYAVLGARNNLYSWSCIDSGGIGSSTEELKEVSLMLALENVFALTYGPDGRGITFSRPQLTVFDKEKVEFRTRLKYRKTRGFPQYTTSGRSLIAGNLLWGPGVACVSSIRVTSVNLRGVSDLLDEHYFKGELNKQLRTVCCGRFCYDPKEPPRPTKQSKHPSYPGGPGKYEQRDPYDTLRLAAQTRPSFCLPTTPRDRVPQG